MQFCNRLCPGLRRNFGHNNSSSNLLYSLQRKQRQGGSKDDDEREPIKKASNLCPGYKSYIQADPEFTAVCEREKDLQSIAFSVVSVLHLKRMYGLVLFISLLRLFALGKWEHFTVFLHLNNFVRPGDIAKPSGRVGASRFQVFKIYVPLGSGSEALNPFSASPSSLLKSISCVRTECVVLFEFPQDALCNQKFLFYSFSPILECTPLC